MHLSVFVSVCSSVAAHIHVLELVSAHALEVQRGLYAVLTMAALSHEAADCVTSCQGLGQTQRAREIAARSRGARAG